MRDIIRVTQGSRVFTVIDLKEGFYHIEIEDKHKHKTAFEFDGVYEWNSMVMRFKNAPHIMQRTMNRVLEDFRVNGVEVYMDVIVIHAKEKTRTDQSLEDVIRRFKEKGLKINPQKIQYRKDEVELLMWLLMVTVLSRMKLKRMKLLYTGNQNVLVSCVGF
ncbi:Transposon Tf2-9 polyprotein [Nosema granulosis]|uniref:Transposon Tf2-9 polyprotein n=1 Tax=Nosema granulosis TaxID=83296 RepID=A0A9P6H0L1_9MICR|nr:Transposon Tf2-9 polyprotein [Nosema granulosis]